MHPTLSDAIFWVAVVCFAVSQVAIARASWRAGGGAGAPRRGSEVAWAVLPGVALAAVLYFTWQAIHRPAALERPSAQATTGGPGARS